MCQTIYYSKCKKCKAKTKVYHLDWFSITCSSCTKKIKIKSFLHRITKIKYPSNKELNKQLKELGNDIPL